MKAASFVLPRQRRRRADDARRSCAVWASARCASAKRAPSHTAPRSTRGITVLGDGDDDAASVN